MPKYDFNKFALLEHLWRAASGFYLFASNKYLPYKNNLQSWAKYLQQSKKTKQKTPEKFDICFCLFY